MRLFAPGRKLLGMNIVSEAVAVIALACLWMAPTCVAQANASTHCSPPKSSVCPAEPCVPDQKTAVRIAEAVLILFTARSTSLARGLLPLVLKVSVGLSKAHFRKQDRVTSSSAGQQWPRSISKTGGYSLFIT